MENTKFEIGEIVWDTNNLCYGVVLNNYPDENYGEIRLDSDGNQPIEDLRKLGSNGDEGTDEDLKECLTSYERLVKNWPEYNYPKIINKPIK